MKLSEVASPAQTVYLTDAHNVGWEPKDWVCGRVWAAYDQSTGAMEAAPRHNGSVNVQLVDGHAGNVKGRGTGIQANVYAQELLGDRYSQPNNWDTR